MDLLHYLVSGFQVVSRRTMVTRLPFGGRIVNENHMKRSVLHVQAYDEEQVMSIYDNRTR